MRRFLVAALLLIAGCVRAGFEPSRDLTADGGLDAQLTDVGARTDAVTPPPGTLDPSFGGKGFVVVPVSGTVADQAKSLALDDQGRIVVGGQTSSTNPGNDVYLARYTPEGTLDTSFAGGVLVLDLNGDHDVQNELVIDAAGRIVAGGQTAVASDPAVALTRLLPSGALDPSFSGDGKLAVQVSTGEDNMQGLALDQQGRLVFSGSGNGTFVVGRVTPGGALDPSFGLNGIAGAFQGGSSAWNVALAAGDRPLAIGRSWQGTTRKNDVGIACFTASGEPDPGFGDAGEVLVDLGGDELAEGLALDSVGRVVVAGRRIEGATGAIFVLRLLGDGTLDPGFGSGGTVLVPVGEDAWAFSVLLDAKGRILVVGDAQLSSGHDLVILRLLPDGTPDTTLGSGGYVTVDLAGRDDHTRHALLDDQGRLLVGGWLDQGLTTDSFIARFTM